MKLNIKIELWCPLGFFFTNQGFKHSLHCKIWLLLNRLTSCQITNYRIEFFQILVAVFMFNLTLKLKSYTFYFWQFHILTNLFLAYFISKYENYKLVEIATYPVLRKKQYYKILVFIAFTKKPKRNHLSWTDLWYRWITTKK